MSRMPALTPKELTSGQRQLYDEIVNGPRRGSQIVLDDGSLREPLNALLCSPAVGDPIQRTGAAIRFKSQLRPDLRELAILTTVHAWGCASEWKAHIPHAIEAGLSTTEIDLVLQGGASSLGDSLRTLTHKTVLELVNNRTLADGTFESLHRELGRQSTFELLATVGYYLLLATILKGYDVEGP